MTYHIINLYCTASRDFKSFGTTWLTVRSVLLGIKVLLLQNVMLSQLDAAYIVTSATNRHLRLTINRNVYYSYHITCYCSFDLVDFCLLTIYFTVEHHIPQLIWLIRALNSLIDCYAVQKLSSSHLNS